jgi:CHAT domain-containing protein
MANQRLRLRGADLEELGRELEEARDAIAALYRDLHRDGGRTPQERADILRKMADRQERERKLWEEIKAKSPLWAALQPVHPPRLEEIVSGLPQGSAVVELFSSPREVYVFLLTPEGLARALALDLPRSTVVGWVALTRAWEGQMGSGVDVFLEEVYRWLFAPLLSSLKGGERLYLVPHGPFHYLPLQAAYRKEEGGRVYLCDEFRVTFLPSSPVLGHLKTRTGGAPTGPLLAIANPTGDLVHSAQEGRAIASLFGGGRLLLGAEATRDNVLALAPRHTFLHFACHSHVDVENPMASFLALADAPLRAHEVFHEMEDLQDCRLVALSACDSATARPHRADELMSLATAFLYAGAPVVLSTQWPVDDLSTSLLMARFYQGVLSGREPAQALHEAQQYLRGLTAEEVLRYCQELEGQVHDEKEKALVRWSRAQVRALAWDFAQARREGKEALQALGLLDRPRFSAWLENLAAAPRRPKDYGRRICAHPYYWAGFILVGRG